MKIININQMTKTESIPILTAKNFDISKVSFAIPKKDDYGSRIYINYDGKPFMVKTPYVRFPFGLSKTPEKYNSGPEPKFTLPMTLSEWTSDHEDTDVKAFYNLMVKLEQLVLDQISEKSKDYFGKKKSRDTIEELFSSPFKRGTNAKTGEEYAPKMTFRFPYYKGEFKCDVHVSKKDTVSIDVNKPEEAIPGGSKGYVVFNMSVYLGAKGYSMPMNSKLVRIKPNNGLKVDFSQVLEDSDEEEEETNASEPKQESEQMETEEASEEIESEESEDEDMDSESEQETEPEPEPEPVKAKRTRKKLSSPE
jgi:hypothetical protein